MYDLYTAYRSSAELEYSYAKDYMQLALQLSLKSKCRYQTTIDPQHGYLSFPSGTALKGNVLQS